MEICFALSTEESDFLARYYFLHNPGTGVPRAREYVKDAFPLLRVVRWTYNLPWRVKVEEHVKEIEGSFSILRGPIDIPSNPYKYFLRLRVDSFHERDLMGSLWEILLINTDLVYPEDRAAGLTRHLQRRKEVRGNSELEAIDKYDLVKNGLTPSVGKGGIFGLVIKGDNLQFTD